MKKDSFITKFGTHLSKKLMQADKKFHKACVYALSDICNALKLSEVTLKNIDEIKQKYEAKLAELVLNESLHLAGKKVHWLNQSASETAKQTLKLLMSDLERNFTITSTPTNTNPVPTKKEAIANKNKTAPILVAHTSKTSHPIDTTNTNVQTVSSPASTKKDNAESLIFKEGDYDFSSFKKGSEDIRKLEFSANCCQYPKLALYLTKIAVLDIHQASKEINSFIRDKKITDGSNISATEVIEFIRNHDPAVSCKP